jgi:hypothetical protein
MTSLKPGVSCTHPQKKLWVMDSCRRQADRVQLVFDRKVIKTTPGQFRTRVIENGVSPTLYIEYKKSSVKQYFKENRGLRTETTINDPRKTFGVNKGLSNLPYLQQIGREINRRLLDVIAVGRPVTQPPPHRSRRAVFSHRALQEYSLPQSA